MTIAFVVVFSIALSKEQKAAYEVIDQGFQNTARTIHAHTRSLAIAMGSESLALLGRKGSWKSRCSKVEQNLQRITSWWKPEVIRLVSGWYPPGVCLGNEATLPPAKVPEFAGFAVQLAAFYHVVLATSTARVAHFNLNGPLIISGSRAEPLDWRQTRPERPSVHEVGLSRFGAIMLRLGQSNVMHGLLSLIFCLKTISFLWNLSSGTMNHFHLQYSA